MCAITAILETIKPTQTAWFDERVIVSASRHSLLKHFDQFSIQHFPDYQRSVDKEVSGKFCRRLILRDRLTVLSLCDAANGNTV